jgi:hypothetical protein
MFDCNLFLFYFFHRKIVPAYEYIQACLLHLLDTEWQVRIQSTENLICYVTHKFLILCNLFCTTWTFDCKWLFTLYLINVTNKLVYTHKLVLSSCEKNRTKINYSQTCIKRFNSWYFLRLDNKWVTFKYRWLHGQVWLYINLLNPMNHRCICSLLTKKGDNWLRRQQKA